MEPRLNDNALTTLDAMRRMLGIEASDTSADDIIIRLINQASASVERALGRKLGKADYTDRKKGTGTQYLLLDNYPIRSVGQVLLEDEEIPPGRYDIDRLGEAGILYKDDGWTYRGYPYGLTGDPIAGSRNITVRYTAGYILPKDGSEDVPSDLPADLEGLVQAMVQVAYGQMQSGGNAGLKSFALSDVRWEWNSDTPAEWQSIIEQYRRAWL